MITPNPVGVKDVKFHYIYIYLFTVIMEVKLRIYKILFN